MNDKFYFLFSLFKTASLYGRIKISEEHRECIAFTNFCKAESLGGSLKSVWFHVANETGDNTKKVWGALLRCMGKICGVSDYVFLTKGHNLCIEFKSESSYKSKNHGLSPSQLLFKQWCEACEIPYYIVSSCKEAIQVLKDEGLLKE